MSLGRRGTILVEASLTYLILGFAVVALVPVFLLCVRANGATGRIATATHLATELLEEVRMRRWDELTPAGGQAVSSGSATLGTDAGEDPKDKRSFDDVDDFNGWSEPAPPGPLDPVMRPLAAFSNYSRTVAVKYVDDSMAASSTPTDYKQVTVCVSAPKLRAVCVDALVTNR